MFYWKFKSTGAFFTDDEEAALVRLVAANISESQEYFCFQDTRDKILTKIDAHLRCSLQSDTKKFEQDYALRLWSGDAARSFFPHFLQAYGVSTKIAVFGCWYGVFDRPPLLDGYRAAVTESAKLPNEPFTVTILRRRNFCGGLSGICTIRIHPADIQRLVGSVSNFVLTTRTLEIHFGPKSVEIKTT